MKSIRFITRHLPLITSMGVLFLLTGCASMDSSNKESLLTAAGFVAKTPETPKQKELYAAAEPYKVLNFSVQGKILYAYKDEKKGVAYVGGQAEYQRYEQLSIQQNIAQDNYMAAQMNQAAAMNWYGAYGPYVYGPRFRGIR